MSGSAIHGFNRSEYVRLMRAFPPVKIRTVEQAQSTETRIEALGSKSALSEAEQAYLDLLSDLLAHWEDAHEVIPDISGVDLIQALMEDRGLRQKDLVGVFATESVASEVMSGRRQLNRDHIERLARYFNVSPAAFFPIPNRRSTEKSGVLINVAGHSMAKRRQAGGRLSKMRARSGRRRQS